MWAAEKILHGNVTGVAPFAVNKSMSCTSFLATLKFVSVCQDSSESSGNDEIQTVFVKHRAFYTQFHISFYSLATSVSHWGKKEILFMCPLIQQSVVWSQLFLCTLSSTEFLLGCQLFCCPAHTCSELIPGVNNVC